MSSFAFFNIYISLFLRRNTKYNRYSKCHCHFHCFHDRHGHINNAAIITLISSAVIPDPVSLQVLIASNFTWLRTACSSVTYYQDAVLLKKNLCHVALFLFSIMENGLKTNPNFKTTAFVSDKALGRFSAMALGRAGHCNTATPCWWRITNLTLVDFATLAVSRSMCNSSNHSV